MNKGFVFLAVLLIASISMAATDERPMLAQINLHRPGALEVLRTGNFDIASISRDGIADIVADDADFNRLQEAGLNPQIIYQDLVAFYQSRYPLTVTMGGFRTLSECLAYMDTLHTQYPNITTSRDSIGNTYQGRAIWMMKISDNPDQDEDEPEFFLNGLIHAREPMGMECCLRFMEYLLSNYGIDSAVTNLVDNREFFFVPIINADGYEYNRQNSPGGGGMWRKNRHGNGIDLNRNWGYMWGYDNNGSSPNSWDETYRGTAAFSEPETQSLREFIDSRHFKIIMNFHSYSNDFLYSWGYFNGYTPDDALFRIIADSATAFNGYAHGTAWEVLYNTNGDSNDWQYGEQAEKPKILGFVMEVGASFDGFWPDPSRISPLWDGVLPSLLYLSQIAGNPFAIGAPVAPVLDTIGNVYADSFTIRWQHGDSLNPAVGFELKEFTGLQRVSDDFEADNSYWALNGFSRSTARHHAGSYSIFSGSQDNYNGSAILNSPITVQTGDTLRLWAWYNIEQGFDYAYVQLSTDGGVTFINLAGNITTNTNPNGRNLGNGITGSSSTWRQAKFPLDDYIGQSVILGMRYITDAGTLNEGFYADDFSPIESFQNAIVLDSNIPDHFYQVSGRNEGNYYYQVRARDAEGQWSAFSNRVIAIVLPLSVEDNPVLPAALSLNQNYPNPFNPTTSISFSIPAKSHVDLSVYDITGAHIATLMNSDIEAGAYCVNFAGKDESGHSLSSGIYFYRLKTADKSLTRKMVFMK